MQAVMLARNTFRLMKDHPRDRRRLAAVSEILEHGIDAVSSGDRALPDAGVIPLIMCLWNRPERIDEVISMLESLDPSAPVHLFLWNNNSDDGAVYAEAVAEWVRSGRSRSKTRALAGITLIQSPTNLGGFGRFIAARLLWNAGYRGPIITLDDDEDVTASFVNDLRAQWSDRSIVAWWGFRLHGSYWQRSEVAPYEALDHAGDGGAMIDIALVADDRFFARLPHRYAFLDDQWMTFVAHRNGWRLEKANTTIQLVSEEKNHYLGVGPLKDAFLVWQDTVGGAWLDRRMTAVAAWRRGRIRPSAIALALREDAE